MIKLGNIYPSGSQNGNIYYEKGHSPTLLSGKGTKGCGIGCNNAPKILFYKGVKNVRDNNIRCKYTC